MPSSMSDSSAQQSSFILEKSSAGLPECGWQWVEDMIGTEKSSAISYSFEDLAGNFGSMPDAGEIVLEVKLLRCVSPSEIIVRARPDEKKFDLLEENMQLAYANLTKRPKRAFDVGFHCAAKVNNFWIRAVVTDIEGSDCTIMSYDDGGEYVVPIEGVHPLIPPFDAIQMFHFKISLINVYPLHSVWLPHVSLRINELLATAKNILVCFRGKSKSNLRTMEAMVVYEYSQSHGPLQIGGRILTNLNEQLVKENLASNQELTIVVRKPSITAWPKALPTTFTDGFLGHVTFLTMDGSVYLYDVNKSANILNEMVTFFTREYGNSQPSSEDLACRKGDLCVSK
jgi:Tudor domain